MSLLVLPVMLSLDSSDDTWCWFSSSSPLSPCKLAISRLCAVCLTSCLPSLNACLLPLESTPCGIGLHNACRQTFSHWTTSSAPFVPLLMTIFWVSYLFFLRTLAQTFPYQILLPGGNFPPGTDLAFLEQLHQQGWVLSERPRNFISVLLSTEHLGLR